MDTSNSQANIQALKYIFGLEKPELVSYSAADWLFIIGATLDLFKPYLKYLPEFKELRELYDVKDDDIGSHMIISPSVVYKPISLKNETRCLTVVRFYSQLEYPEDVPWGSNKEAICREEMQLLITQEGRWVLWHAKFTRKVVSTDHFLPPSARIEEKATSLVLLYASLEEMIKKYNLGFIIFSRFHLLLKSAIEQRRERLRKLVLLFEKVNRISGNESAIIC